MAALRLGMEGEKYVGQSLEALRRQECQGFHDLLGDGFNIDHVVVAPQGVFVIETKTRSKPARGPVTIDFDGERVLVNGFAPDRDPVPKFAARLAGGASASLRACRDAPDQGRDHLPRVVHPESRRIQAGCLGYE